MICVISFKFLSLSGKKNNLSTHGNIYTYKYAFYFTYKYGIVHEEEVLSLHPE